MVFIDADHSYDSVKEDIKWALKLKIPIISGHDYHDLHLGVVRAVDEVFGSKLQVIGTVWAHINND